MKSNPLHAVSQALQILTILGMNKGSTCTFCISIQPPSTTSRKGWEEMCKVTVRHTWMPLRTGISFGWDIKKSEFSIVLTGDIGMLPQVKLLNNLPYRVLMRKLGRTLFGQVWGKSPEKDIVRSGWLFQNYSISVIHIFLRLNVLPETPSTMSAWEAFMVAGRIYMAVNSSVVPLT